jgi:hypothetical protein
VTVAKNVDSSVLKDCGHFFPEERPEAIVRHVQALKARAKHFTRLPWLQSVLGQPPKARFASRRRTGTVALHLFASRAGRILS